MRTLHWSEDALSDLERTINFIGQQDPRAAHSIVERIEAAANMLAKRPIGRIGRMTDIFEKSVLKTNYIIAYKLTEAEVRIMRVMHSAQNWTADHWPAH